MFIAAIVLCSLMAPLIAATLYFDRTDKTKLKTLCKGLTSLCFVIAGVLCYCADIKLLWKTLVLSALVMGLVGDVLLAYKAKSEKLQMGLDAGGMLFFIAGHVLFMAAFFLQTDRFKLALIALLLGLPILVVGLFSTRILNTDKPVMQIGAIIYSFVISFTLASAINLRLYDETLAADMILAGTVLFAVSDCILALVNYNSKIERKKVFPFVLLFYYTGQALIALSMAA